MVGPLKHTPSTPSTCPCAIHHRPSLVCRLNPHALGPPPASVVGNCCPRRQRQPVYLAAAEDISHLLLLSQDRAALSLSLAVFPSSTVRHRRVPDIRALPHCRYRDDHPASSSAVISSQATTPCPRACSSRSPRRAVNVTPPPLTAALLQSSHEHLRLSRAAWPRTAEWKSCAYQITSSNY